MKIVPFVMAFTCLCMAGSATAQVLKPEKSEKTNLLGLIDATGKYIVKAEYDEISTFADGIYLVTKDGDMGLIDANDPKGKFIQPMDFKQLNTPDINGLCLYNIGGKISGITGRPDGGKWGFLNIKGVKVGEEYEAIIPFGEHGVNLAAVNRGGKTYQNSAKLTAVNAPGLVQKGKWGFIDPSGKEIIPCEYDAISSTFSENIIAVKKGSKCGLMDASGKMITKFIYESVDSFSEGLAFANTNGLFGYIDTEGKEVIKSAYHYANRFLNGVALVGKNISTDKNATVMRYGFIRSDGSELTPIKYVDSDPWFLNGVARVSAGSTEWGLLGINGVELTPITYSAIGNLGKDITWVNKGAKHIPAMYVQDPSNPQKNIRVAGIADLPEYLQKALENNATSSLSVDQKELYNWHDVSSTPTPMLTKNGAVVNLFLSGYIIGGNYGFVNNKGEEVVACNYMFIDKYYGNRALALDLSGKCCWLDKNGKEILSTKYTKAGHFNKGVTYVRDGMAFAIIDSLGKEIQRPTYTSVGNDFQDGLLPVKVGSKWGCIDTSAQMVIPALCDNIDDISNMVKIFYLPNGRKTMDSRHVKLYLYTKPGKHNSFAIGATVPDDMWSF